MLHLCAVSDPSTLSPSQGFARDRPRLHIIPHLSQRFAWVGEAFDYRAMRSCVVGAFASCHRSCLRAPRGRGADIKTPLCAAGAYTPNGLSQHLKCFVVNTRTAQQTPSDTSGAAARFALPELVQPFPQRADLRRGRRPCDVVHLQNEQA
jgi:hypothetical protein